MNAISRLKLSILVVTVTLALGWGNVAKADVIFTTGSGAADTAGDPVSAMADFSLSGNTLTLTLTNMQGDMNDAGQLLTDVFFTLSSGSASMYSQTGDLIDVASDKTVTDLGSGNLGWGFGSATVNSINGFELCVICQGGVSAGSTPPTQSILGPASLDGKYDNANSSIAKTGGPHNPFVNQTATFTFTGITTGATIDNVIFSFGTTPGDNVPAVPEPSYLSLLGLGAVAAVWVARRNSRRNSPLGQTPTSNKLG